ncbi:serine protease [Rhizoctonia solani AG-3 Rhs1AP]|uniref:Serine protease n=2 Tax=Rhizoctonia solani AG-3 TaxID=1086053 RepID=A0A074S2I6_9AGAM|nr:serine protease [Rhizoctonia solani AG-3 Rhs1AP]KEP51108.1 serine protease [Rhizoctonia solani 123E]
MKSFALIVAALIAPVLAAPAAIPITKLAGPVKENSYIIKLKDGVSKNSHVARLLDYIGSQDSKVVYKYENAFNGYAGILKGPILEYIRRSPDIQHEQGDESLASPNLRTEEEASRLVGRAANGGGVDIYGLDTGILTTHTSFGGRATWGATYGGYASRDGNGHGTHTAGTAAGSGFGLATAANIIAVKVCSDAGECATSDIVAGVNFVVSRAASSGRPTIATMSLGGPTDTAIDSAVSSAISRGIHFTVAAGNENQNAANVSPARVAAANTIGAVDSSNRKASFSNYGAALDVWALGVNVRSAWIGSNSAVNTISGTSMATPQVAGILAVVIGNKGNSSPAALSSALKSNAQALVTGAPSGTT